jgi:hypothetical protein
MKLVVQDLNRNSEFRFKYFNAPIESLDISYGSSGIKSSIQNGYGEANWKQGDFPVRLYYEGH